MKKNFIFLAGICFLLSACGKGDNSSGSTSANAVAAAPSLGQYSDQTFSAITAAYGYYFVNYKFYQNGCSTRYHEFWGNTDAAVRDQLCATLQSEWANRGCARDIRNAYFLNMCPGKTWTPQ